MISAVPIAGEVTIALIGDDNLVGTGALIAVAAAGARPCRPYVARRRSSNYAKTEQPTGLTKMGAILQARSSMASAISLCATPWPQPGQ